MVASPPRLYVAAETASTEGLLRPGRVAALADVDRLQRRAGRGNVVGEFLRLPHMAPGTPE